MKFKYARFTCRIKIEAKENVIYVALINGNFITACTDIFIESGGFIKKTLWVSSLSILMFFFYGARSPGWA